MEPPVLGPSTGDVECLVKTLADIIPRSIETHSRTQCMVMEMARQAIDQQAEIQNRALRMIEGNQELILKMTSEHSELGKIMGELHEKHLSGLMEVIGVVENETRMIGIDVIKKGFEGTKDSLDRLVMAQVEQVKTGSSNIDPTFFSECTRQTGMILAQITEMTKQLAEREDSQIRDLTSVIDRIFRNLNQVEPR